MRAVVSGCSITRPGRAAVLSVLAALLGLHGVEADANRWTLAGPEGTVVTALAVDPIDPSTLYANSPLGVYKSADGGGRWILILENPDVSVLAVDPQNPATVYAGAGSPPYNRGSIGGLFKSTDGGRSWRTADTGLSLYDGFPRVLAMAIDPWRPTTLYASVFEGGIFKSSDGGESWRAMNRGLTDIYQLAVLAIDPVTPTTLYTASGNAFFKTTDGGENWSSVATGMPPSTTVRTLAIDPTSPTTLYAGTSLYWYGEVFKSMDGGSTWASMSDGLPSNSAQALSWFVSHLVLDPAAPGTLYAVISTYTVPGRIGLLFKSTDGGGHWAVAGAAPSAYVSALMIDPRASSRVYAGSRGDGIFMSTDGGTSWIAVNTGLPRRALDCLVFDPQTPTTQYANDGASLHKSTNKGASWSRIGPFPGCPTIDTMTPTTMYARGFGGIDESGNVLPGNGLGKTTDGGVTWRGLDIFGACTRCSMTAFAMDPRVPTTLYVGGARRLFPGLAEDIRLPDGRESTFVELPTWQRHETISYLFRSTDGGERWTSLWSGSFQNKYDIDSIVVDPLTSTAYASHDFGIMRFGSGGPDCGEYAPSWQTYANKGLAIDSASPTTLYAQLGEGLFTCTGVGRWAPINNGLPVTESGGSRYYCAGVPAIDPHTPTNLYSSACGVLKSIDGGQSWIPFDPPLPHGLTVYPHVEIDPRDPSILYARTKGGLFTIKQRPKP